MSSEMTDFNFILPPEGGKTLRGFPGEKFFDCLGRLRKPQAAFFYLQKDGQPEGNPLLFGQIAGISAKAPSFVFRAELSHGGRRQRERTHSKRT